MWQVTHHLHPAQVRWQVRSRVFIDHCSDISQAAQPFHHLIFTFEFVGNFPARELSHSLRQSEIWFAFHVEHQTARYLSKLEKMSISASSANASGSNSLVLVS